MLLCPVLPRYDSFSGVYCSVLGFVLYFDWRGLNEYFQGWPKLTFAEIVHLIIFSLSPTFCIFLSVLPQLRLLPFAFQSCFSINLFNYLTMISLICPIGLSAFPPPFTGLHYLGFLALGVTPSSRSCFNSTCPFPQEICCPFHSLPSISNCFVLPGRI